MGERPYWAPELADAEYFARLRKDYPEDTAGQSDEELADYFEVRGKYATTWDHAGDAYNDYEPLADDWIKLREALSTLIGWAKTYMEYHGRKYAESGLSAPTGLWPAIKAAEAALHTNESGTGGGGDG